MVDSDARACPTSSPTCVAQFLVPCWDAQGGEDFFGFGGQGVGGGEVVAVEVDGDLLEGLEGTDNAFDADPGGLLEVPGDGQGGHDHGQVRLDGIALVVEDGAGWQVVLTHPERLLHVPQLVIRGDHLTGAHQAGRNVGDVALEAHQGAGPGQGGLVQGGVTGVGGDEPGALGTSLSGDDGPSAVGLGGQGPSVPGGALLGVGPHRPPRPRVSVRVPDGLTTLADVPLALRAPPGGDGVNELPISEGVTGPVESGPQGRLGPG